MYIQKLRGLALRQKLRPGTVNGTIAGSSRAIRSSTCNLISLWLGISILLFSSSCAVLKKEEDAFYNRTYRLEQNNTEKEVILLTSDSLKYLKLKTQDQNFDTSANFLYIAEDDLNTGGASLTDRSLEFDLVTVPAKLRPAAADLPYSVDLNLTACLFVGYRYERLIASRSSPNKLQNIGFSVGTIGGLGTSMIAPWFTNDQVQAEYNGICLNYGLAVFFNYRNQSIGLSVGMDHLLDKNRDFWIYQDKPWLGLTYKFEL